MILVIPIIHACRHDLRVLESLRNFALIVEGVPSGQTLMQTRQHTNSLGLHMKGVPSGQTLVRTRQHTDSLGLHVKGIDGSSARGRSPPSTCMNLEMVSKIEGGGTKPLETQFPLSTSPKLKVILNGEANGILP